MHEPTDVEKGVADVGEIVTLTTSAPVAGGAALAREAGGRVVFITGALPGERVDAEITEGRRDFARAATVRVIEPSSARIRPPCPYVPQGCGGCDLQHAAPSDQPSLKLTVVIDALRRLGRLTDPAVEAGPPLPAEAFRTTVRCGVVDDRAGFRRARSHDVLPVDRCLVAHPLVNELIEQGRFAGADEVTLRVGATTGERLVLAGPTAAGVDLPEEIDASTLVVGEDELANGKRAWIHDEVAGHRFRISAHSFFQTRHDGAELLAGTVRDLGGVELASAARVIDAYGGVGLFAVLAAPSTAHVTLVESSRSAIADARQNLADRDAKVIRSDVERWRSSPADVVIADPARAGLGARAVRALTATQATVIVLVSCDAAALGRDARLLAEQGFALERSVLVDLFPQTHHVEVVSRFSR
jgi:23S rRNA (uracil1939-C5)-methyltransferase